MYEKAVEGMEKHMVKKGAVSWLPLQRLSNQDMQIQTKGILHCVIFLEASRFFLSSWKFVAHKDGLTYLGTATWDAHGVTYVADSAAFEQTRAILHCRRDTDCQGPCICTPGSIYKCSLIQGSPFRGPQMSLPHTSVFVQDGSLAD